MAKKIFGKSQPPKGADNGGPAKRPRKAADSAAAGAAASDAHLGIDTTIAGFYNPNTSWHQTLTYAMDTIRGTFGADIDKAEALTTTEGGYTQPIDEAALKDRFESSSACNVIMTGGVNVFWANPLERRSVSRPVA